MVVLVNLVREAMRSAKLAGYVLRWGALPAFRAISGRPMDTAELAVRLRHLAEDMGITFVKLGQYLAVRPDVLPRAVWQELSHLYAHVRPMPYPRVEQIIREDLGAPPERLFASVSTEPVAAASIAQVHRAVTRAGECLALKVQRPEAGPTLAIDVRLIRRIAWLVDRLGLLNATSAVELVDEVAAFTRQELDFELEALAAERLRHDAVPGMHVPEIRWDLTSGRVLAMEYVEGRSLLEICQAAERGEPHAFDRATPGSDPREVVETIARAYFHQLFVTGRFHGDPHPANIVVQPDGRITLVDFGIYSEFDETSRRHFCAYMLQAANGNVDEAFRHLIRIFRPGPTSDVASYRRETLALMRRWLDAARDPRAPIEEKLTAGYQGAMFGVMRRYGIRMPSAQVLFWRALGQVDATANRVPVPFDLLTSLRRFLEDDPRLLRQSFDPSRCVNAVAQLPRLPRDAAESLDRLASKQTGLRIRVESTPSGRRRGDDTAKDFALAILALSFALPAALPWGSTALSISGVAASAVLLLLSACRILRR